MTTQRDVLGLRMVRECKHEWEKLVDTDNWEWFLEVVAPPDEDESICWCQWCGILKRHGVLGDYRLDGNKRVFIELDGNATHP
jgi:hypothetical protein